MYVHIQKNSSIESALLADALLASLGQDGTSDLVDFVALKYVAANNFERRVFER